MNGTPFSASGFFPRMATAAVLLAVFVPAWAVGGIPFFLLVTAIALLAQWEFYGLFPSLARDVPSRCLGMALGACLLGTAWFAPDMPVSLALGAAALVLAARHLVRWRKETAPLRLQREAVTLCGLIYIPLLLSPAARLSSLEQLFVLAVPILSDSAAYFAGTRFGRHKLWPSVSPQKSMEGAAAGLLAAVAVSLAFGAFADASPGPLIALGLVMGVMSQFGDLFESALKRASGAKDSGSLLPGHGGALDRVDSLLFACAAYAFLASLHPFFG
jgi:phosphatidate cytidylyltransferase